MTDPGDDDDQLRAMRAVWLSMREDDAEPSARGMADLLAAARAHAVRPEPAWRRVLAALADTLRRPPVLALATVVVVAGTAVLVKSHGGLDTQAPGASTPAPAPTGLAAGSAAPPSLQPNAARDLDRAGAPGDFKLAPPAPAPAATAPARMAAGPAPVAHLADKRPAPSKPEPPVRRQEARGEGDDGMIATKDADAPPVAAPAEATVAPSNKAPASHAGRAAAPATAPTLAAATPAPPPRPPSNDQLLRACQAAAARGDCAAVRAFAERMRVQDAAFYRSTFSRDADIAKCLPSPK